MEDQWLKNLGIHVNWTWLNMEDLYLRSLSKNPLLLFAGWMANYYDPNNLFVEGSWNRLPDQEYLWDHQEFKRLIQKAKEVMNQEERINLYMQADCILVEEAPIMPLWYGRTLSLQKPWVKGLTYSSRIEANYKDVIIEEH